MKKLFTFCFFILSASASLSSESYVYIIEPKDGSQVVNPVRVVFGLSGMGVAPAGVDKPGTGHHHLLIDLKRLPDLTKPIPTDKNHLHFGGGQTETTLNLEPGNHDLQLILGNWFHVPHSNPLISKKITIEVKE
ncbi:DUF4399 domain-containing protein [Gammaproteobacteria bacterium]|nr:DUF4399 domain-containing protein [Gammaproteobacteria bacterium]